jgi:voltage-gated potassium channel
VQPGSDLVGQAMRDSGIRKRFDLIIVGIKRADGEQLFNPTPETGLMAGDTLIALGMRKNLDALEACCAGG